MIYHVTRNMGLILWIYIHATWNMWCGLQQKRWDYYAPLYIKLKYVYQHQHLINDSFYIKQRSWGMVSTKSEKLFSHSIFPCENDYFLKGNCCTFGFTFSSALRIGPISRTIEHRIQYSMKQARQMIKVMYLQQNCHAQITPNGRNGCSGLFVGILPFSHLIHSHLLLISLFNIVPISLETF